MGSVGTAVLFFVVALATRLPFRTEHLWSHDAVLYARAVVEFDPAAQRPQPPGHLWYVLLVRAVSAVTGDANAAMTLISAVAAAAAVALLFLLGSAMYDRRTGVVAASFLLTSVTFWGESGVAYPYTLLALLSVLVVLLFWRAMSRRSDLLLAFASLVWGIAMGFRLDLAFLAPAWIVAAAGATWRGRAVAVISGAIPVGVWALASGIASGDLARFAGALQAQSAYVAARYGVADGGLERLAANARETLRYLGRALYALAPLVVAGLAIALSTRRGLHGRRAAVLLTWIVAPLPAFLLVHIGEYGYVFGILPGLCVVAADAALRVADRVRIAPLRAALVPAVIAVNAGIFLFSDTPLALSDLGRRDRGVREKIDYIERVMDPARTVIAAAYDTVIVEHYLGERYAVVGFDPDAEGRTAPRSICAKRCAGRMVVVWDDLVRTVGPRWLSVGLPSGSVLRVAELPEGTRLRGQGLAVHLEGPPVD